MLETMMMLQILIPYLLIGSIFGIRVAVVNAWTTAADLGQDRPDGQDWTIATGIGFLAALVWFPLFFGKYVLPAVYRRTLKPIGGTKLFEPPKSVQIRLLQGQIDKYEAEQESNIKKVSTSNGPHWR